MSERVVENSVYCIRETGGTAEQLIAWAIKHDRAVKIEVFTLGCRVSVVGIMERSHWLANFDTLDEASEYVRANGLNKVELIH